MTSHNIFSHATHGLHVKDGGLGDDHWPVPSVTLQLRLGPLAWQLARRVVGSLWHGSQTVLPHEFSKVLSETRWSNNQNHFGTGCIFTVWLELHSLWSCSLWLGLHSPRWWRAGPPGWSGCCWARAERSRRRGCWACGWWPLTPTSWAAPEAPTGLRVVREVVAKQNVRRSVEIEEMLVIQGKTIKQLVNLNHWLHWQIQIKAFIHLTVQEKISQTWRRSTVHVGGRDAIRSSAVMKFWGGKKFKQLNQASFITVGWTDNCLSW